MKRLVIVLLLLPAIVLSQKLIVKNLVTEVPLQTEYRAVFTHALVGISIVKNKKTIYYTILDGEFEKLAAGRGVDIHKSVTAAYLNAKKANKKIKVDKNGSSITCDPSKESSHSIIKILESAAKNGYRRTGNEDNVSHP